MMRERLLCAPTANVLRERRGVGLIILVTALE